jgi:hypothetical protein
MVSDPRLHAESLFVAKEMAGSESLGVGVFYRGRLAVIKDSDIQNERRYKETSSEDRNRLCVLR